MSRVVGTRNSDQCSSHWSQVLDPGINYCDWSTQEVSLFFFGVGLKLKVGIGGDADNADFVYV